MEASDATIAAIVATTAAKNLHRGGGHLVNIERSHAGSGTAVGTVATCIACLIATKMLFYPRTACTAVAAIATACADACTCTAAVARVNACMAELIVSCTLFGV